MAKGTPVSPWRLLHRGIRFALAFVFLLAGTGKLDLAGNMATNFQRWGLPQTLMVLTGAAELVGGLLLLVPRFDRISIPVLLVVMAGAIGTHAVNFAELGWPVFPVSLAVALSVVACRGRS